ncbi:hypothetical protein [Mesorhizobium sp.]|uniref:hypothetical protein n=1 Tax=Mesorhizobium sp. TaxID=1871066 RepID=UPI000FE98061|nr:hypothetical protein [Mesorhizobium sp.]RWP54371.1 MAG: hypothetical protein EOR06_10955 [Mesorhizobium sp.]
MNVLDIPGSVSIAARFFDRRWGSNFLYIHSDIDEDAIRYVVQETETIQRREFLFLFLSTERGRAEPARAIVSYLNDRYTWVSVVALEQCNGAGAAICTGFDEVWISEPNALQTMYQGQVPFHMLDRKKVWSEFKLWPTTMMMEGSKGTFRSSPKMWRGWSAATSAI